MRSRAKADGRWAAVLAAAAVWLGAGTARAEVVYDLAPAASGGITDNARLDTNAKSDQFTILEGAARARYLGARNNHTAAYRLAWTHYYQGNGVDNLSNELLLLSNLNPTATFELTVSATATLSRVSRFVLGDPATGAPPQGTAGGTNLYLALGAAEEGSYRPSARWHYIEGLTATRVTYLDSGAPPDSLAATARGRAEVISGLNTYSLEATSLAMFSTFNSVAAQLLVGWLREFSPTLSTEIQAGAMAIFRNNGSSGFGPAGNAVLSYRRIAWFATLNLSRIPTMNLFLGEPTVNNQALVRLTLPLNREGTAVISGMASYLYANPIDAQFTRAYDQRSAAALVGTRLGQLPLYASLEYTVLSQHNNPEVQTLTPAPNLFRQVLMLNLRALFTFGPGTPPILGAPI